MSLGTLLTLYVVPCVYSLMGRREKAAEPEATGAVPQAAE